MTNVRVSTTSTQTVKNPFTLIYNLHCGITPGITNTGVQTDPGFPGWNADREKRS